MKIDFVIPWVDGADKKWQSELFKYSSIKNSKNKSLNTDASYKNWDNLHYIFRAFEYFTPWVNKIFFITQGHIPAWLNVNHEKLKIIKHKDYIPKEHLPTFSSHSIEINLYRIKELSEHFVYFNDDFFILSPLEQSYFFRKNLPVDFGILDAKYDGNISHIINNDIDIINKNFNRHVNPSFSKKNMMLQNFTKWFNIKYGLYSLQNLFLLKWKGHTGFIINHFPQPYLKSTFTKLWEKEEGILTQTSKTKFRSNEDVNQYLFRYWQLVTGQFYPGNYMKLNKRRKYVHIRTLKNAVDIAKDIQLNRYHMYCINDGTSKGRYTETEMSVEDFEKSKALIGDALEKILPKKSSFEK